MLHRSYFGLFLALTFVASGTIARAAGTAVPVMFREGLPVVSVRLGARSDLFMLDTGSRATLTVPMGLIDGNKTIHKLSTTSTRTDLSGRVFHPRKIRIDSAKVGGLELGPLTGLVNYRWGAGDKAPEITRKGIVGLGAFDDRTIDFDLGASRLVIYEPGESVPAAPNGVVVFPLRYDDWGMSIRILVDDHETGFILDSAATASFISNQAPVLGAPGLSCTRPRGKLPDCPRRASRSPSRILADVALVPTRFEGFPFDGLLGVDFFRRNWIRVDFRNATLSVASRNSAAFEAGISRREIRRAPSPRSN